MRYISFCLWCLFAPLAAQVDKVPLDSLGQATGPYASILYNILKRSPTENAQLFASTLEGVELSAKSLAHVERVLTYLYKHNVSSGRYYRLFFELVALYGLQRPEDLEHFLDIQGQLLSKRGLEAYVVLARGMALFLSKGLLLSLIHI